MKYTNQTVLQQEVVSQVQVEVVRSLKMLILNVNWEVFWICFI